MAKIPEVASNEADGSDVAVVGIEVKLGAAVAVGFVVESPIQFDR
jgi:hypothetical protein